MWDYFNKIYRGNFAEFQDELSGRLDREEKAFVITANPETLMIGQRDAEYDAILRSADTTIVPDGIGVVKGANMLRIPLKGRVTGVETVQGLFGLLNEKKRSLYLFGAKKEVLELLKDKLAAEYPNIQLAGACDGYAPDKDAIFDEIVALQPDVVLVAMGIPMQEKLISKHYHRFQKGIFIGVGGSFDVLSGSKKRAPAIFCKLNLEWLYRILCEPSRFKRFYDSNVKFIFKIKAMQKGKNNTAN
jgi:N-acetylglucosaminyldiphosphoundecaprenol N-acetyl-beta-D-mannosaminyltransferase